MALEFGEKLRNIVRDNAQTMTMIAQARKFMRPDISDYAEDKKTMMAKRRCCHMIIDNNDIKLAVVPVGDSGDKLVCSACGAEIDARFDKNTVDVLNNALKVIDKILLFGIIHNMKPEIVQTLIDIKAVWPDIAQCDKELNIHMTHQSHDSESLANVGAEYANNPITRLR